MSILDELNAIESRARAATAGPYFVSADEATDCPDHEGSGLAMVDTGRNEDWPIARLCEWPQARFIAAARTDVPKLCEALKVAIAALQDFGAQGALVRLETILTQPETKP